MQINEAVAISLSHLRAKGLAPLTPPTLRMMSEGALSMRLHRR
jgi:hypothetical protein